MFDKIEASIIVAQNRINELNKIDFTIYLTPIKKFAMQTLCKKKSRAILAVFILQLFQLTIVIYKTQTVVNKFFIHCQNYQTKFFYHLIPFDLQQLRFQDEQNL